MEVTTEDVRIALAKIRRRKGISSDSQITVIMIANTIGCTRNTLYKKSLDKIMGPFKKIKKNESDKSITPGSIEYCKAQLAKKDKEIKTLKEDLSMAKDGQIDQEILSFIIKELEKDKIRLQDQLDNSYDEDDVVRLAKENAALREQLLRAGLKTQI